MGHDHMSRIKMHMAEDSLGDKKCCQEPGCNEVDDGGLVYCKIHSGGLPCQQLSHLQSVQESSGLFVLPVKGSQFNEPVSSTVTCSEQEDVKYEGDDRCKLKDCSGNTQGETAQYVFRGAGMLCKQENCSKQTQDNTIYCKLHCGVSKGCMVRGCPRGAHGGTPLCIGHGGGKRCVIPGCPNAACGQGCSDRCVRHGGGKRCKFEGCAKGAQGNTDYCIRHGGGRRCKSEGCTKSAQGRTYFCIKHGGGSRCKFQGCSTSAKWGTDFCSVHRKSLFIGDNAIPEALPASKEKRRRAKKPKKADKPSELSQGNVTTSAIAGSSTQQMGVVLCKATMVPNHAVLIKGVTMTGQAAIAPPQIVAPLSMKSPTPSGPLVSADRVAGASKVMLGL
ncbi:probable WRKY transcription factor 19 isoform X2 [Phragmites australis]|nr:probable WRKY transcription factor 19 isoform X2 [Phragmites australis]XP_062218920.1 probable WRKY transcription factor 19 isoform X2 [Phragmites australis]